MKTIFIFIYGYIPGTGYGGPVTSISNFVEYFGDKYDIRIVTSNHDHKKKEKYKNIKKGWNKVGKASVLYLNESEYKSKKFYNLMKDYDVTMVYLTGVFPIRINGPAIEACKKLNIPVVIATRGEICCNILKMKKIKKVIYLRIMKFIKYFKHVYFQVTSDEEYSQLKKYLNVEESKIIELPNLHSKKYNIKLPEKKVGELKLVFISRIHPKKNLLEALKALSGLNGKVELDIYGAIEDENYWEKCKRQINILGTNIKVNYVGVLDMLEARKIYYNYHAFIFPTLSENYGHVIVESIIANCIPIITKNTTPWDDLENCGGYLYNLHDINELSNNLQRLVYMNNDDINNLREKLDKYKEEKLKITQLINGYEELINISI